jgi:hypothetical protein
MALEHGVDHVSWNSEVGRVSGTIRKKITRPIGKIADWTDYYDGLIARRTALAAHSKRSDKHYC